MLRSIVIFFLVTLVISFFALDGISQGKDFKYIGSAKCKMCHSSKKSGEAYKIWEASSHAKAYQTLASEEAKNIAKTMGIDDPQKSEKCLDCHVTGHGVAVEEGVGCESCHGPGSEYKNMKVMKQIYAGEVKGADYGLINPGEAQCKTCHNEKSPTYKPFDYSKKFAEIAHSVPKDTK